MFKSKKLIAVGAAGLAAAALGVTGQTAARAAIADPSLVMSNNQSGASSNYTYTFTPGITATNLVGNGFNAVLGIPGGAIGLSGASFSVYENTGSGWGSALAGVTTTPNTAGTDVQVSAPSTDFTGLLTVPQFKIVVSGLTNPGTIGSYGSCIGDVVAPILSATVLASTFTTGTGAGNATFGGLTLLDTGCLTATITALASNGVTQDLSVAPILNVTLPTGSTDSFSVTPSDTGVALTMPSDQVLVKTNALTYTVQAQMSKSGSALTWDGSGTAHSLPITATSGACTGSPSALPSGSWASLASGLSGLTNGTTTTITYCANSVNLTYPAGNYSGTITYLVVPSF